MRIVATIRVPPGFGKDHGPIVRAAVHRGLHSAALRTKANLTRETQRKASDTGTLAKSWFLVPWLRGVALYNTQAYAAVIEYGRRPGTMPPVEAIEVWVRRKLKGAIAREWAKRKAIQKGGVYSIKSKRERRVKKKLRAGVAKDQIARSLAWAVAKSIKRKGTKPRWIYRGMRDKVRKHVKIEVNREIRKASTSLMHTRR